MLLLILGASKMMTLFFLFCFGSVSCKLVFPSSSKRWIYRKGIIRLLSEEERDNDVFPLGPLNHDARNKIKKKPNYMLIFDIVLHRSIHRAIIVQKVVRCSADRAIALPYVLMTFLTNYIYFYHR
jgi:hypothetical protein